jgi:hypothetical protein
VAAQLAASQEGLSSESESVSRPITNYALLRTSGMRCVV